MRKTEFIISLFARLEIVAPSYFVLGSYQELPHDTGGSDIDIVVPEMEHSLIDELFQELLQGTDVKLVSEFQNLTGKFFHFLSPEWGVQIDFFFGGLHYRGVTYFPVKALLPQVIEHNGIRVLELVRGYYVDYLKEILHNGKAKEKYVQAFLTYYQLNADMCRQELQELYGDEFLAVLENCIKQNGPVVMAAGKKLQHLMQRHLFRGNTYSRLKESCNRFARIFQRRPGYVMVVEGTDGSGKSFVIDRITPWLNECFHNTVIYNHLRPNAIPAIGVLTGKRSAQENGEVNSNPHGKSQSGLLGSLLRWGYYQIDYTLGYLLKVWPQIHTKSKLFIFDRYYYDYYFDQKRSRINLPQWILRLGECMLPKPDVVLCLGGDPEKIYARKPETSLTEVSRQTKELKDFSQKRANAVWIDTTLAPEETLTLARAEVLKHLVH